MSICSETAVQYFEITQKKTFKRKNVAADCTHKLGSEFSHHIMVKSWGICPEVERDPLYYFIHIVILINTREIEAIMLNLSCSSFKPRNQTTHTSQHDGTRLGYTYYCTIRDVNFQTFLISYLSIFRHFSFHIFFRIKETCIKLIKYGQNMDKISILSKDRLAIPKGWIIQYLHTHVVFSNNCRV